jgi:hypothetical protein
VIRALLCALLVSSPAFAQVEVRIRTDKDTYFAGEPIFVLVEARNIGAFSLGYGAGDGDLKLTIDGIKPRGRPGPCGDGYFEGSGGGVDHPPLFAPGRSVSFKYLLRGYRLLPGQYRVRVAGKAVVMWFDYTAVVAVAPNSPPRARPPRQRGDPVDGADVDVAIPITIAAGSEEQLKAAFAPVVDAAAGIGMDRHALAAIYEMAPPFLAETIATFASDPNRASRDAYDALAEINTAETRAHLRRIFDETVHLGYRTSIVRALVRTGARDNFEFLASLLQGRSREWDDRVREAAVRGLGCVGGDAAAQALAGAPRSNEHVRYVVSQALGNTRSRLAVSTLIEISEISNRARSEVCGPLKTLTHYQWCTGSADSGTPARWRRWWRANGHRVAIHPPDRAPEDEAVLPLVR